MKDNFKHINRSREGSALAVSIIMVLVVSAIAASALKLALSEHRTNKENELYVEAMNAAELGIDYGYATVIKQVSESVGIYSETNIFNRIETPSSLKTHMSSVDIESLEIRGSDIINPEKKKIDWNDPSAKYDEFRGKYVYQGGVDLYCKVQTKVASMDRPAEAYVKKEVKIIEAPLFSHALFFNDELQIHRPVDLTGDVHTNGNILINTHNGDATMQFFGSVNAAGNYYRGTSVDGGSSGRDPFGNTPTLANGKIDFSKVVLKAQGQAEIQGTKLAIGLDSRTDGWDVSGKNTYGGNFTDSSQGATDLTPVGSVPASRDDASTNGTNEYNNGGYSLIEPLLPKSNAGRKADATREKKLAANADLIIRVEYNTQHGGDPAKQYVLKGYKYNKAPSSTQEPTYTKVRLPNNMIGAASEVVDGLGQVSGYQVVNNGNQAYPEIYDTSLGDVTSGLMDTRTGRPMDLFTLDMSRLKEVIETPNSKLDNSAKNFRNQLGIENDATSWDGIVYVEFPTSLTPDTTQPLNKRGADSYPFEYAEPETKSPVELSSVSSPDREDGIVPVAAEFRTQDPSDVGMGLQIINAGELPSLNSKGFTLASNGSVYTVGHYNADGDLSTGTGIGASVDNTFATADSSSEIAASIFGDSVTILSKDWPSYRSKSNRGTNGSTDLRKSSAPLEVSAAIVTGDFPVFEFFVRSLEKWQHLLSKNPNPLVVKGSLVSLYDSEIPLIKNAFGRNVNSPIDLYWNSFASHAFTTVRYHQFFADGRFPPGTPNSRYFKSDGFTVLYPNNSADKAELKSVGFTF
ncbi:MAG: hypothetical protein ACSHYA_06665 [Opitutaceae bacterium]